MSTEIERRMTRADERATLAEILQVLRTGHDSTSEALERLMGVAHNTVLLNETIIIPASGTVSRDWSTKAGSALVFNYSAANQVTSQTSEPSATAPAAGVGVNVIPASTWIAFPADSAVLTVYGTAGDKICIQAFTGLIAYGCGAVR